MKKQYIHGVLAMMAGALLMSACATMQTEVKTTVSDSEISDITKKYEIELVALDGRFLAQQDAGLALGDNALTVEKQSVAEQKKTLKLDAENYLSRLQAELASPKMSRPLQCRLLALMGRASIIDDKPVQAKKYYTEAASIESQDVQVIVLSLRLEDDYTVRLGTIEDNFTASTAPIEIEQAVAFYYLGQYAKSAAAFDAAFTLLDDAYRSAYSRLRDTAWVLQNAVGTVTADSTAEVLTADGMLLLLQSETNLLISITSGKTLKAKELAAKMVKANLLDESVSKKVGDRHATLLRSDVARTLWKLYVSFRNAHAETDYAAQFEGQPSPISDVPVTDISFNAVAGCVENELMELPDGVHFFPNKTVSGPEFIGMAKKTAK